MKEFSIEEKAQRYDEAIERLRNAFYGNNSRMCEEYRNAALKIIKPIFPELKESEDERIRKDIISHFAKGIEGSSFDEVREKYKIWIAWLEKQGEQKHSWSEEDEDMCYKATAVINRLCAEGKEYVWSVNTLKTLFYWLKSLKDRVLPKVELTQLDKNILEAAIAFVEQNNHFNCWRGVDRHTVLSALRSLRPQNTWKPSDEQMKALANALSLAKNCGEESAFDLRTLHEQLKKLREE